MGMNDTQTQKRGNKMLGRLSFLKRFLAGAGLVCWPPREISCSPCDSDGKRRGNVPEFFKPRTAEHGYF